MSQISFGLSESDKTGYPVLSALIIRISSLKFFFTKLGKIRIQNYPDLDLLFLYVKISRISSGLSVSDETGYPFFSEPDNPDSVRLPQMSLDHLHLR